MKKLFFIILLVSVFFESIGQEKIFVTVEKGDSTVKYVASSELATKNTAGELLNYTAFGLKKVAVSVKKDSVVKPPVVVDKKKIIDPKPLVGKPFVASDFQAKKVISTTNKTAYFLKSEFWQQTKKQPQNGIEGFDYNPIVGNQNSAEPWQYDNWSQDFVLASKRVGVVKDGTLTYYFQPDFVPDNGRLMDFDLKFPDFSAPKNRIISVQTTPLREGENHNFEKKGITHSRFGSTDELQFVYLGDDWLFGIGMPHPYRSSYSEREKWIRETDASVILEAFKRATSEFKDKGLILLNWEAVNKWYVDRWKIENCLKWYHEQHFKAKLGAYGANALTLKRVVYESDINTKYFVNYTNVEANDSYFFEENQADWCQYFDVIMVGGYMNMPQNVSTTHHYLIEYLINKKIYPDKPVIGSFWNTMELVGYWPLGKDVVQASENYYRTIKPAVFTQQMWNWGVWATAVGDGFDVWSENSRFVDDKEAWWVDAYRVSDNKNLPWRASNLAVYPHTSLKNENWLMSGVWAVSQHKDIVEAETKWTWGVLPDVSFANKSLMYAYKLSADKNEVLILALDAFTDEQIHEYTITVEGKPLKIKTFGSFSSVIRTGI